MIEQLQAVHRTHGNVPCMVSADEKTTNVEIIEVQHGKHGLGAIAVIETDPRLKV